MAGYSRTASQFLAGTFAPFGAGVNQRHHQEDDAPLFFSSVDGVEESRDGVAIEDGGLYSRYYDNGDGGEDAASSRGPAAATAAGMRQSRHQHQRQLPYQATRHSDKMTGAGETSGQQQGIGGSSEDGDVLDEDAESAVYYDHDGLGVMVPSAAASDTSDDPFRSNGASSRQSGRTPATVETGHPQALPRWRMLNNGQPPVKQSVLHNLFEQSESVYTSVFIGNKQQQMTHENNKGKQRERDSVATGQPDVHAGYSEPTSSRASPKSGQHILPVHHQHARPGVDSSSYTDHPTPPSPPRVHRYPMPTSKYRRTAATGKSTPDGMDLEWQDQSYRDPLWLGLYLFNVLFTSCLGVYLFLFDHTADSIKTPSTSHLIAPSLAILRSIPLLSLLIFLSLFLTGTTMAYVLLVKNGARQIAFALLLLPPIVFLIGAGWAFEASYAIAYNQEDSSISNWAAGTLRLFSLFLLISAALAFRRTWKSTFAADSASRRARLERTIRVLEVSSSVLVQHPQLIVLAMVLVAAYIVSSVPVILMVAKLLYHGIILNAGEGLPTGQHSFLIPSTGSIILSLHTVFVYFWSLGLLRAVYQHTIAGTVAAWWYGKSGAKGSAPLAPSASTFDKKSSSKSEGAGDMPGRISLREARVNVTDAVHRAIGPSLGTLCASSLILAILSMINLLISLCYMLINRSRRWTSTSLPATVLRILISFIVLPLVAILGGIVRNINSFTLVYSAVTGDKFWEASAQASDLIMGRNSTEMVASHLMVKSLLSVFSLALAVLGGVAGYISSTYWLSGPAKYPSSGVEEVIILTPLLVGFICAIVPFWTVRFSSDLLSNAVDATFVCFNIDLDIGENRHKEVFDAFAYEYDEDSDADDDDDMPLGLSQLYNADEEESV